MAHSRSMSQPSSFFANNCLPPLSPLPPTSDSSLASSTSNFKDLSMEEIDVSSRKAPTFTFRGNEGRPPVRGHRRSSSDVPLGFSAMIQSSPQLVPISGQGMSESTREAERKINKVSGDTNSEGEVVNDLFNSFVNMQNVNALNYSGNKDKESSVNCINREGVKRSATEDIVPPARHYRSLSMDSGIGNFQLGNISPSMQNQADHFSPGNSASDNSGKANLDFGHGEFNEFEMKKIMGDERLAEIAISDPKRAKRILANRQSAARSKERKLRYISELEHKVQMLQTEATTLSAQFTTLQKNYAELANENNELKFRFQAMEQQAKLRDALHEALNAEVQRLKLANMELREDGIAQQVPLKLHMFTVQQQQQQQQPQPNQMQPFSVSRSSTSSTS